MPVLGITGGIATGKSSFVQALERHLPAEIFDADAQAHELLAQDPEVRQSVREAFGAESSASGGLPDRTFLREIIFGDSGKRSILERILHPAIRERWMGLAERYRPPGEWLLVDIPLLYETGAESSFDRVIVVACSPVTQHLRLRERRRLEMALIEKMVGAQQDLRLKMQQADHIIWNDSTVACLDGQARLMAGWLRKHYG